MRYAAALAALVLLANPAFAQDSDDSSSLDDIPHITIVGTAEAEIPPDLATIMLGVTTEKPSAGAAAAETARKAQAVIDAAKAAGIAPADIATQSVTLAQTFDDIRDKDGHYTGRKPRGFVADNTIAIRVRDLAKAGPLAETLIDKGANRFDGIAFSVEKPQPILDRLVGEAVKNARDQARIAAQAAGAGLGRVLLVERPDQPNGPSPVFGTARLAAAKAPAPAAMPVEAGTTIYRTEMAVTWALDAN